MNSILQQQKDFFLSGATLDVTFRIRQLKKLRVSLINFEEHLYNAIWTDFRKSRFETYATELALVYQEIDIAIRNLKQWSAKKRVSTSLINFPAKSYIIPEPVGTVLIIGPWNYPYQLALSPLVAAIAAGCTAILKPSELPSNTSKVMKTLLEECFDIDYVAVVEGGVAETTSLLDLNFDHIFFTGSTRVGRIVYQAAAKHLTPVTLELGGKSPAIIFDDATLKMTVKRLVWAKFLNAGQTCIAPDYVLVQQGIETEFLELLSSEIERASYKIEHDNYVQIINHEHVERLSKYIQDASVYHGGTIDVEKRFIEPTVIVGVGLGDPVMQEEIFGPILPILTFQHKKEALEIVRSMEKPLAAYVFTSKAQHKNSFLKELSFGGGAVNDAVMQITSKKLPFGGVGTSGIGSYHGEHGFRRFSHYKGILDKPTWFELPLKYYPRTAKKLKWIKTIFKI